MPGTKPYDLKAKLQFRDFVEKMMVEQGWTQIGWGYAFGVAEVLLKQERNGKEVQAHFFVTCDGLEMQIQVFDLQGHPVALHREEPVVASPVA